MVLLHGAFGTAEGGAPVLPALTRARSVIVIEQRGGSLVTQRRDRVHASCPESRDNYGNQRD